MLAFSCNLLVSIFKLIYKHLNLDLRVCKSVLLSTIKTRSSKTSVSGMFASLVPIMGSKFFWKSKLYLNTTEGFESYFNNLTPAAGTEYSWVWSKLTKRSGPLKLRMCE